MHGVHKRLLFQLDGLTFLQWHVENGNIRPFSCKDSYDCLPDPASTTGHCSDSSTPQVLVSQSSAKPTIR